jgi:hypothetical protein
MQQQGLLTICAVKKSGTKPKLDYNGDIYDQEFYVEETGDFESIIHQDLNENQIQALEKTIKKPIIIAVIVGVFGLGSIYQKNEDNNQIFDHKTENNTLKSEREIINKSLSIKDKELLKMKRLVESLTKIRTNK